MGELKVVYSNDQGDEIGPFIYRFDNEKIRAMLSKACISKVQSDGRELLSWISF